MAQLFMALKRTRGCAMTLKGSVAEYLSHMQKQQNLLHPTYLYKQ